MNKIFLTGRTTKDIQIKTTSSNIKYIDFTIAVARKSLSSDGEKITDFIRCKAWRGLAENICKFVKKGDLINIIGRLETRSFDNEQGTKSYITEVLVDEVDFIQQKNNTSQTLNMGDFNNTELPF